MKPEMTKATIHEIIPLTNSILQLILAPTQYIDYVAGQYLQILFQNEALSYSIANAPLGSHKYELHLRHSGDNPSIQYLLKEIKEKGTVNIKLPLGDCHLNHFVHDAPILFIAAGTGFAPIKAMIEQLLADGSPREFELFWGARTKSDLYMDEKLSSWQKHVSHFRYFSQSSELSKHSLATEVLKKHGMKIAQWQILISGPLEMVFSTREELIAGGALKENLFSDAFSRNSN